MKSLKTLTIITILLIATACTSGKYTGGDTGTASKYQLESMNYTIQVGAFSQLSNAVRLEAKLDRDGLEAYYFRDDDKLYKVRFGNFKHRWQASQLAYKFKEEGIIEHFFIVNPDTYEARKPEYYKNPKGIRGKIVQTAKNYIGIPYRWGGTSSRGFDCSGLTMVTYRLNGLNLPRVSRSQYKAGTYVKKSELQPGDLVFFATSGGRRVSHVGIYIGKNQFVHAPGRGKHVRTDNLNNSYWQRRYISGRSYI